MLFPYIYSHSYMALENDYKLTAQEHYRRFVSSLLSEVTKE